MAYRIGIRNREGTRMAIFTETMNPETQSTELSLTYQHPSLDAAQLVRMRSIAETQWQQRPATSDEHA